VHAVTNRLASSVERLRNSGDLQMTFSSGGSLPIVISLRDALGNLEGAKRMSAKQS